MKNISVVFTAVYILLVTVATSAYGQDRKTGVRYIETPVYSEAEDAQVLEAFQGLRVADVSDGMDMVGLVDTGLVDPSIHPDWVDTETMSHVFRGIAVTVRYVPTQNYSHGSPVEIAGIIIGTGFKYPHKWVGNRAKAQSAKKG